MREMAEVRIEVDPEVSSLQRYVLMSDSGVEVAFVPAAGMVGTSLTLNRVELLGRRAGLTEYVEHAKTFGIPLLAPWANRLAHPEQSFDGRTWTVRVGDAGVHPDEFAQPIHGLLAACDAWVVDEFAVVDGVSRLTAHLDFDPSLSFFDRFPFEHSLTVTVTLAGGVLRVETTLRATGASTVPVAFGWHPYFAFPNTPRADWVIDTPFTAKAELNDLKIPTGQVLHEPIEAGPLGGRAYDDVFVNVDHGAVARISGTEAMIEVRYVRGYSTAVVFAPTTADVVCFEPMTAPTDPFSGTWPVLSVAPGNEYSAIFEIEISGREI
jgi:galactose mutarotase-like enzyme